METQHRLKVVVAHPHQQHSYRLASAVKLAGHDLTYVTTVYDRPWSLTRLAAKLLRGTEKEKARSRRCEFLSDSEVNQFCEFGGLFVLLLFRLDPGRHIYNYVYSRVRRRFGFKAAKLAKKIDADVFIGYDACSRESFSWLEKHAPHIKRVIDYSALSIPYQAKLAFDDLRCTRDIPNGRIAELLNPIAREFEYALDEMRSMDFALVASEVARQSLVYCGVARKKIFIASYGFPENGLDSTLCKSTEGKACDSVTFGYCGRLTIAKGVHHLLRVYQRLEHRFCKLVLIGAYENSDGFLDNKLDCCELTGSLVHDVALRRMAQCDVLVFPSLMDGMSLSCMEAMALGLPVIVTDSTGASRFIENGVTGFIVRSGDENALYSSMQEFLDNPELSRRMGQAAREVAASWTWNCYNFQIASFLKTVSEVLADTSWGDCHG